MPEMSGEQNDSQVFGLDGRTTLKLMLEKYGVKLWSRCNWLSFGSNGGLL